MQWRSECYQRFGNLLDLPIRTPQEELAPILASEIRVLDFGAGAHKPFEQVVKSLGASYFSLDNDIDGNFDFRSFDEIPEELQFHIALANQVLEHMTVDAAFSSVASIFDRLVPEGILLATVPNAAHPVRQWDCTHVTPWPINDLYSLLRSAGFDVINMFRYNKRPLTSNPIKRWIIKIVCSEFRIDWCDSIMGIARKPGSALTR